MTKISNMCKLKFKWFFCIKALNVCVYVIIFLEAMVQLHEFKKKNIQKRKPKKKNNNKQTKNKTKPKQIVKQN